MCRPGHHPDSPSGGGHSGVIARAVDSDQPMVRVWTPSPRVSFGRQDRNRVGYREATDAAKRRGYAVTERAVGGHPVALTGSSVAFRLATPTTPAAPEITDRYELVTAAIESALETLDISVERGEPPASFCPGTHSLSAKGKVAGFAQRIRRDVAVTAGLVVVSDHDEIGSVLEPVYEALAVPFDPGSVGSVSRAGGPAAPETVVAAVETALAGVKTDR